MISVEKALKICQREFPKSKLTLIDSSDVGDDEGDDVLVVVYRVVMPGIPEANIDPHETVRWAIFNHSDVNYYSNGGIIR